MAEEDGLESIEDAIPNDDIVDLGSVESHLELKIATDDIADCSLDKIAMKLLKYNFILTALELHTELVESGRELPRLRDFFSNPGNFEKNFQTSETSPVLPRTSSIQTFDSLDFARYSDDGEKQVDERVAVLEFELRKAKETIKSLRANLTVATESDPSTPSSSTLKVTVPEVVKPHEKRALNFLVNEYLLYYNYKLTSITFSDENDDQDFEDWDDVLLNIPKPPDLLQLYRNFCRYIHQHVEVYDKAVEADIKSEVKVEEPSCDCRETYELENRNLRTELLKVAQENEALLKVVEERDELQQNFKKLIREVNMLKTMSKEPVNTTENAVNLQTSYITDESTDSLSILTSDVPADSQDFVMVNPFNNSTLNSSMCNESFLSYNDSEIVPDVINTSNNLLPPPMDNHYQEIEIARSISHEFQKSLQGLCQSQKIAQDNRLVNEVAEIVNSKETVVMMLSRCLPHIVPNVLLAKREELIPLILCTITLHPNAKQRDKLLNILFNLIKKPDEEQRHMILTGLVAIAQHLGHSRVEAELLPQCWEQITHRYAERRLLVAESCGVLAPYVPSGIRNSLLLSMLQQMLQEDKEELVREAVVRNLALLFVYVNDSDKFTKGVELLHLALEDRCINVVESGLNILLPSIAAWALELGKLESHLFPSVMKSLEDQLKRLSQKPIPAVSGATPGDEQQSVLLIQAIYTLLHFLLLSVIQSGPYVESMEKIYISPTEFDVDRLPVFPSILQDPSVILGDANQLSSLVKAFDKYISAEWYKPWEKFEWLVSIFLPWLQQLLNYIHPQRQAVIHSTTEVVHQLCHLFGRSVTQEKVKPSFVCLLKVSEEEKDSGVPSNRMSYNDATLPVYIAGVLTAFHQEEDGQEMLEFLQELVSTVSVCHFPITSMKAAYIELSANKAYHELLLSVLWDGVVHTSPLVRVTAGRLFETLVGVVNESLLRTRVTPALVTLASDPEIVVRIATVPAFGAIMEISSQKDLLEKVHLQLQTFLDDPVYWDQYLLHVEVIRTFAKVGPNTEPKFRDEFVLPRLAALAAQNNSTTNETRKADIALALLEAYTAMSCCFMSDQLISEAFLPGLRCLKQDLQIIAPEHEESVNSMIREFEAKQDLTRSLESRPSSLPVPSPGSMEDMKNRVSKIFTTRTAGPKPNIPNLFRRK